MKTQYKKVIAAAAIAGIVVFSGARIIADEGSDLPKPVIRSYDIGDNAPRVVGWCFGADAIYQANESDGITVVGDSSNCVQGGILYNGEN